MLKPMAALLLVLGLTACDTISNLQWAGTWGSSRTPQERRDQRDERQPIRPTISPRT